MVVAVGVRMIVVVAVVVRMIVVVAVAVRMIVVVVEAFAPLLPASAALAVAACFAMVLF